MKLLGQRSLIREGGSLTARSENDCQHQGGREPGFDGMANTGELLLNTVKINELKMLTSSNQKGVRPGRGSVPFPLADETASGEQAGPNPSGYLCETW